MKIMEDKYITNCIIKFIKSICIIGFILGALCLIFGGIYYSFAIFGNEINNIEQINKEFFFSLGFFFACLFIVFFVVKKIDKKNNKPD